MTLTRTMIMIMVMIMMMSMSMTMIMVSLISYHCQHRLWLPVSQAVGQHVSSVSVSCIFFSKKSIAISTWSWLARLQVYSSNGIFSRHCGSSAPTQGYHERSRATASAWGGTRACAVFGRGELVSAPQNSEGPWYQHIAAGRPHVVVIAPSGCIKSINILGHDDGYGVFECHCQSQATPIHKAA